MTLEIYSKIISLAKENPWLLVLIVIYVVGFIYLAIKNNF